ncbi:hypothetical protein [Gynuella sunshinyii]|uniref:Lipoprotein n=1 Tax=Gynuella sunshinyii YC6258 TaxID=1445510 RepID=A0A0C5VY89_9GAMM|nr:hypothetical protein [Gynuella sunshinyii]AJQ95344.1 hypothetical Protein YC6258_03308 [Gynuella sunshinyii YC6258]
MKLSLLMITLVLVGCASAPITQEQAIAHAISADATMRNLVSTCYQMGGQAKNVAYSAKKTWWAANAPIVEAADRSFINAVNTSFGQRETAPVIGTLRFTQGVQNTALAEVQALLGNTDPAEKCIDALAPYVAGEKDLMNDPAYAPWYREMMNQTQPDLSVMETAKLANAKQRKYGRSLYLVQSKVVAMGCQNADITLLRNQWPLEVYDAQCADKTYLLARCEWGKCDIF